MYSIPGLTIGILISALLNVIVAYFIYTYSFAEISYLIAWKPALWGISLGIVMPLISNILPIKRALSKTIRDALDIFHQLVNDISVKIVKLESMGFSPFQLVLGITLISVGIMTYYLVPASFLFERFDIFFYIINIILIGMLLGVSFLCFLVFRICQKAFVFSFLCCFRRDRKLKSLIYKNLESHGKRNSKTSIMFTITLAFLIFAGTSFALVGNMIQDLIRLSFAADMFCSSRFS